MSRGNVPIDATPPMPHQVKVRTTRKERQDPAAHPKPDSSTPAPRILAGVEPAALDAIAKCEHGRGRQLYSYARRALEVCKDCGAWRVVDGGELDERERSLVLWNRPRLVAELLTGAR